MLFPNSDARPGLPVAGRVVVTACEGPPQKRVRQFQGTGRDEQKD